MIERYLQQLIQDAYGSYQLLKSKPKARRDQFRRQQQARLRLFNIISIMIIALFVLAKAASAQEFEPKYRFEQPSDEMDFTLPPISDIPEGLPSGPPPAPGERDLYGFESSPPEEDEPGFIDQFFSTTTIVAPDAQPEVPSPALDGLEAEEEEQPVVKKRRRNVVKRYQKPPHQFKSVRLPSTIYHKQITRDNYHHPLAYMEADQQELLEKAIKENDINVIRSLARNGANISATTASGTPMLTLAVQHHSVDAVRWLLMHRVNPNNADADGLAPLHYAAFAGNHEIVELLLHYGADKQISDTRGHTPLQYAQANPLSTIVERMLSF